MKIKIDIIRLATIIIFGIGVGILFRPASYAADYGHGSSAIEFKTALEGGDITPLFSWVKEEDKEALRKAFNQTLAEGKKNPKLKEQLNKSFFDMFFRMHREKQGTPYDADLVNSKGSPIQAVVMVNKALDVGSVDTLVQLTKDASAASGIRERFNLLLENKKHRNDSLEASDEFKEAFIDLVNYIKEKFPAISE